MKGQIAEGQRNRLVRHLHAHRRAALKRLAKAVEGRDNQANALNFNRYSRMHHRHNKSL